MFRLVADENSLLEALPRKMKADLAISVHYEILSKVTLFQDCDKMLLFDLVLKLKPVLYLPKDFICLKVKHVEIHHENTCTGTCNVWPIHCLVRAGRDRN